jgi:nitroreductase
MTATDQTPTGIEESLYAAVDAARYAPSLHNAQPWRWRVAGGSAELYADADRAIPVTDPLGRELRISCGAALELARLTLAAAGWRVDTACFPDADRPDLVARLSVTGHGAPDEHSARLAAAIPYRRSDRRPYARQDVPGETLDALVRVAEQHGARLVTVDDEDRRIELAVLADRAARIQESEPGYQDELARWTGARPDGTGIIPAAVPHLEAPRHTDVPLRDLALRNTGTMPTAAGVDEQPVWCLLATDSDTAADQVRAGRALAAVLLTATALGLATGVQSQPIEVPGVRLELEHWLLSNLGRPQALIRVGWPDPDAAPLPTTPRRALADVLVAD